MKFAEIKELLDKGFTPEQITTLVNEPEVREPDVCEPETKTVAAEQIPTENVSVSETKTEERLTTLEKAINELTKTIQANAIINEMQPGQSVKTDMDILASVLNPGGK